MTRVKLPKELCDELNAYKSKNTGVHVTVRDMAWRLNIGADETIRATIMYAKKNDTNFMTVLNAWRYGWATIEKHLKEPETGKIFCLGNDESLLQLIQVGNGISILVYLTLEGEWVDIPEHNIAKYERWLKKYGFEYKSDDQVRAMAEREGWDHHINACLARLDDCVEDEK